MLRITNSLILVCCWVQFVSGMGGAPVGVSVGILADSDIKLDHEAQARTSRIAIRVSGNEGVQVEALTPERTRENRERYVRIQAGIERVRTSNKWLPEKFFITGLVCSFLLLKLKVLVNERKAKKEHDAKQQENR